MTQVIQGTVKEEETIDQKLFLGRWMPDKTESVEENGEVYARMNFWFGHVIMSVNKSQDNKETLIRASGHNLTAQRSIDAIFDPEILEMYQEAKKRVIGKMGDLTLIHPELNDVNIEDYSNFQRATMFQIEIDYEKLGIDFDDVENKVRVSMEIYQQLEDELKTKFNVIKDEIGKSYTLWVESGNRKELDLEGGIYITVESPGAESALNAGVLYFYITSDETCSLEAHKAVDEFMKSYLNDNFKDQLKQWGPKGKPKKSTNEHVYGGYQVNWNIDFSKAELPALQNVLTQEEAKRYLTSGK
jgi:hypothetical protein